jgi:hypothetical protein
VQVVTFEREEMAKSLETGRATAHELRAVLDRRGLLSNRLTYTIDNQERDDHKELAAI